MTDAARGTEQVDGFQYIFQVVRRFAHAHDNHPFNRPSGTGEHDLGNDLGAIDLAQQAIAASHAENAADGTADLGRYAQAVARQKYAFYRLTIG